MVTPEKNTLVPYKYTPPGFEAVYTGQQVKNNDERTADLFTFFPDDAGNEIMRWSTWGMTMPGDEVNWPDEIKLFNSMQEKLGDLDDDIRQIRAHIGSLVLCDNGVPVTIDQLLDAIGKERLDTPSFHNGCWMPSAWWEEKTTQLRQVETMVIIEDVLKSYMDGKSSSKMIDKYPNAEGFINRFYEWYPPVDQLTELQKLQLDRLMLLFDFLTKRNDDHETAHKVNFADGSKGEEIDAKIAELAGLPTIYPNYKQEYRYTLESITDPDKKELYKICGNMTHGLPHLSDCHHSTFRRLERWIHSIATGKWDIESRNDESERERLGNLLFGYSYALDKWMLNKPMQLLIMDLDHSDLRINIKNEIIRVYAYLGERTPVKEWLAACMWYKVTLEQPASLYKWGWAYKGLLRHSDEKGINLREWIESVKPI